MTSHVFATLQALPLRGFGEQHWQPIANGIAAAAAGAEHNFLLETRERCATHGTCKQGQRTIDGGRLHCLSVVRGQLP